MDSISRSEMSTIDSPILSSSVAGHDAMLARKTSRTLQAS
jgi:hypothetical protein